MMKFLSNLVVNLRATGPAAVLISWAVCITLLGIFGSPELGKSAINVLSVTGAVLVAALGSRVDSWK